MKRVGELTATEASRLLEEKRIVLIDCREEQEWDFCYIDGSLLIPLSDFQLKSAALPQNDSHYVVYCHHGVRSLYAAQMLQAAGYTNVSSMTGGIDSWSLTVDPSVPRY